jgi:hypothetical protein
MYKHITDYTMGETGGQTKPRPGFRSDSDPETNPSAWLVASLAEQESVFHFIAGSVVVRSSDWRCFPPPACNRPCRAGDPRHPEVALACVSLAQAAGDEDRDPGWFALQTLTPREESIVSWHDLRRRDHNGAPDLEATETQADPTGLPLASAPVAGQPPKPLHLAHFYRAARHGCDRVQDKLCAGQGQYPRLVKA